MKNYQNFIKKYPKLIIGIVGLLTIFFGYYLTDIKIDNSISSLLPATHPAMVADKQMRDEFDYHDIILIGFINDSPNIFQENTIKKIKDIGDKVKNITIVGDKDSSELKKIT